MPSGDLLVQVGILPAVVVTAWPLLWWRGSRRLRLWFAALAPAALIAGLVLSDTVIKQERVMSCSTAGCESWFGLPLMANCLLALVVGAPLGIMTAVIDVALLRDERRSADVESAARVTRGGDQPPFRCVRENG